MTRPAKLPRSAPPFDRERLRLRRLTLIVAAALGGLIGLGIPAVDLFALLRHEDELLDAQARRLAWRLRDVAPGDDLAAGQMLTEERLNAPHPEQVWFELADGAGRARASSPAVPAEGLAVTRTVPVLDGAGRPIGEVRARYSLDALKGEALLMGVVGLAGGLLVFAVLALVPRFLLRRTFDRVDSQFQELEATRARLEQVAADLNLALEAATEASQSKSQFLAAMSHELRTPLNAVIGFAELLEMEVAGPMTEHQREYLSDIRRSAQHLLTIINDILDLARLDAGRLELEEEVVDAAALVAESLRMIRTQATSEGLRLIEDLPAALPRLRVDPRRMRQILLNLLSNAVKFTPAGGEVRVRLGWQAGAGVTVTVADTGIGMAPDDIPRALERFGQLDGRLARRYEGAGLGLPITQRLVRAHGGDLTIESAPGQGTRVTVALPPGRVVGPSAAAPEPPLRLTVEEGLPVIGFGLYPV